MCRWKAKIITKFGFRQGIRAQRDNPIFCCKTCHRGGGGGARLDLHTYLQHCVVIGHINFTFEQSSHTFEYCNTIYFHMRLLNFEKIFSQRNVCPTLKISACSKIFFSCLFKSNGVKSQGEFRAHFVFGLD